MVWVPQFKLYDSTGTSLLYTFPAVEYTNAPQSAEEVIEVTNIRSKGSLFIEGGETVWNLELRFNLYGDDYGAVTALIENLENTIEFNEPYVLRIDKTGGSYFEYKVKRLRPFTYPESLRNFLQKVQAVFTVNSW